MIHIRRRIKLQKGFRSWVLVLGLILILIACLVGYFSTKSAEADVSIIQDFMHPSVARSA